MRALFRRVGLKEVRSRNEPVRVGEIIGLLGTRMLLLRRFPYDGIIGDEHS